MVLTRVLTGDHCAVTLSAALFCGDRRPQRPAHAWPVLLALAAQVAGGLLIGSALPRLPAAVTSLALLLQPRAALLSAVVRGDRASATRS